MICPNCFGRGTVPVVKVKSEDGTFRVTQQMLCQECFGGGTRHRELLRLRRGRDRGRWRGGEGQMTKIVSLGGRHRSAQSLLAEAMNDPGLDHVVIVAFSKDGDYGVSHYEMTRERMCFAAELIKRLAFGRHSQSPAESPDRGRLLPGGIA